MLTWETIPCKKQAWLKLNDCTCWLEVAIISPWKEAWPLNWSNLNPLFPQRFFVPSLVEFCPVVLEIKTMYFLIFCYYWNKAWLSLKKLESRTEGCFVLSLDELTLWFWRRRRKCEKILTQAFGSSDPKIL